MLTALSVVVKWLNINKEGKEMKILIVLLVINLASMVCQLLTVAYGDFTMVNLTAVIANAIGAICISFIIGKHSGE